MARMHRRPACPWLTAPGRACSGVGSMPNAGVHAPALVPNPGCDVDPRDVGLLLPGPLLHSESLDLSAFRKEHAAPPQQQEAATPPPRVLQDPHQLQAPLPLLAQQEQQGQHLPQQRPHPTSSQLRRARRARAKVARAASAAAVPPSLFAEGDGCAALPVAGLAAMSWCHVQAARGHEPELDAAAVQVRGIWGNGRGGARLHAAATWRAADSSAWHKRRSSSSSRAHGLVLPNAM